MAYLEKILFLFSEFSIVKVQLRLKAISRLISKLKGPRYLGPEEKPEAQKMACPVLGSLLGGPGFAQMNHPPTPQGPKGAGQETFQSDTESKEQRRECWQVWGRPRETSWSWVLWAELKETSRER